MAIAAANLLAAAQEVDKLALLVDGKQRIDALQHRLRLGGAAAFTQFLHGLLAGQCRQHADEHSCGRLSSNAVPRPGTPPTTHPRVRRASRVHRRPPRGFA